MYSGRAALQRTAAGMQAIGAMTYCDDWDDFVKALGAEHPVVLSVMRVYGDDLFHAITPGVPTQTQTGTVVPPTSVVKPTVFGNTSLGGNNVSADSTFGCYSDDEECADDTSDSVNQITKDVSSLSFGIKPEAGVFFSTAVGVEPHLDVEFGHTRNMPRRAMSGVINDAYLYSARDDRMTVEEAASTGIDHLVAKNKLLNLYQVRLGMGLPPFAGYKRGSDHMATFYADVDVSDLVEGCIIIGRGVGPRKTVAENCAAVDALLRLKAVGLNIDQIAEPPSIDGPNPKAALNELYQFYHRCPPAYVVRVEDGTTVAELDVGGKILRAVGTSRARATTSVAKMALDLLKTKDLDWSSFDGSGRG